MWIYRATPLYALKAQLLISSAQGKLYLYTSTMRVVTDITMSTEVKMIFENIPEREREISIGNRKILLLENLIYSVQGNVATKTNIF